MPEFKATPVAAHAATFLSFVAFLCCLAAEFKRARVRDLKLDGNLCSLPGTPAFGLGVSAIACLFVAQVLGTSVPSTRSTLCAARSRSDPGDGRKKRPLPVALLVLSWAVFGMLLILLGTASSMNNGQSYGRGWLDGECYVVHRGVYLGSATLILVMLFSLLGYVITANGAVAGDHRPDKLSKAEANQKVEMAGAGT